MAIEAICVENPLSPVVPWKNQMEYKIKKLPYNNIEIFDSFTAVALQHWTVASRQYISNKLDVDSVGTLKKFAYAIRYLDEAVQLIQNTKITDFSLYDEIRTKINNFEFVLIF